MIKIIGIGNMLYSDEGVGVHVIPSLEEMFENYPQVEVIEGSTDGIRLLEPVEATNHLIIIDAINAGKEPGTLITLINRELPIYFGIKMSIHQLGFQEVLGMALLRERLPENMVMFGLQPASLKLGMELSEEIKQQLPLLIKAVKQQVDEWLQ